MRGIVPGDYVMVSGTEMPQGSDTVAATRIEQEDSESTVLLQGIVDTAIASAGGFELTILGKTVSISSTATSCEGPEDESLDCATMVASIVEGQTIAKASGTWDAVNMILDTANDEVSIED